MSLKNLYFRFYDAANASKMDAKTIQKSSKYRLVKRKWPLRGVSRNIHFRFYDAANASKMDAEKIQKSSNYRIEKRK